MQCKLACTAHYILPLLAYQLLQYVQSLDNDLYTDMQHCMHTDLQKTLEELVRWIRIQILPIFHVWLNDIVTDIEASKNRKIIQEKFDLTLFFNF